MQENIIERTKNNFYLEFRGKSGKELIKLLKFPLAKILKDKEDF